MGQTTEKLLVEVSISALQVNPIVTTNPAREIFIESITYPTRLNAVCRFRVTGPEFSRQDIFSIEGIAKSQVDILVDTNALSTVSMVRI
ncbi:unnamed protein product [Soboliphyme baturini]|uniref:MSP domain-containing protein n=1 Tax=Soboliphyme baturini TaxID=241478 RepID=A0A183IIY4_9BILA|nr:unnamed protein product [Soboliphyme baturini]